MPCLTPLKGWRSSKGGITFKAKEAFRDRHIKVPCGQCRYCRIEHSRQWAVRAVHEAKMHERNCFITLTYSDEHLPENSSLDYSAAPLWLMRVREKYGAGIRSFGCAEYGEKYGRPHYHVALFNFDFPDKTLWKTQRGFKLYTSQSLSQLWPFGHAVIADLTFESAAYIARYVTKKFNYDKRDHGLRRSQRYHSYCDLKTREEKFLKLPERSICVARKPGLGKAWFDKNYKDTYKDDTIILRGKRMRPPKYYDYLLEKVDPKFMLKTKISRHINGKEIEEPVGQRALDLLEFDELKFKQLIRGLERET